MGSYVLILDNSSEHPICWFLHHTVVITCCVFFLRLGADYLMIFSGSEQLVICWICSSMEAFVAYYCSSWELAACWTSKRYLGIFLAGLYDSLSIFTTAKWHISACLRNNSVDFYSGHDQNFEWESSWLSIKTHDRNIECQLWTDLQASF